MTEKAKYKNKIRAAMILKGYTQADVAKALGVGGSTLSKKLNGHSDFTLPECIRIAKLLGRTLDDIFFE